MDEAQSIEFERVVAAARDSLTDDMVNRLSATAAEGMDLLDKVNRSGIAGALPALAQLVRNGDLERLVAVARTYGAAEDAMNDEMVARLAQMLAEMLSIIDRLQRGGLDRLVDSFERLIRLLEGTMGALEAAKWDQSVGTTSGGLGGLWQLMRDPENQKTLRFLLVVGHEMRKR